MRNLTKTKVIRISEQQHQTLQKMKSYNVDVSRFIRDAIKEKIDREYDDLIPSNMSYDCRALLKQLRTSG